MKKLHEVGPYDRKFLLLAIFFLLLRLVPIWLNNFPFNYDNAKDSLVIMQTWMFKKPALLGAVTSMEGLYQGPFWYYILFPLNFLMDFHPIASVITVNILGIFTLWLVWKHIGKLEAFLMAVSLEAITIMQTAWSPYLTFFSVAWIYIILTRLNKTKLDTKLLVLLSISVSLMFHAQIAIGILFIVIIPLVFWINKFFPSRKQIFIMLSSFFLGFVPQLLFELRHSFIQTKSVLRFTQNFSSEAAAIGQNESGLARIWEIFHYYSANLIRSISPYPFSVSKAVSVVLLVSFFYLLNKRLKKKDKRLPQKIFLPILIGSMILHLFLPVKLYYLVAYTPLWIFAFSKLLKTYPKFVKVGVVVAFIGTSLLHFNLMNKNYKALAKESRILFAPKLEAVIKAYELGGGEPFCSYHYVPELYDYTYQHIYQYLAFTEGRSLPVEYSYEPNVPDYIVTSKIEGEKVQPRSTILIVERDEREELYSAWFDRVTQGKKVVDSVKVNDEIDVYKLIDENNI